MKYVLHVGLCLFDIIHVILACSCLPPQDVGTMYCNSDFVMKVLVTSDLISTSQQQNFLDYYEIQVLKQYKKPYGVCLIHEDRAYTASNGALCGVSLDSGAEYIISGSWNGTILHLQLCQSISDKSPFSDDTNTVLNNPSC